MVVLTTGMLTGNGNEHAFQQRQHSNVLAGCGNYHRHPCTWLLYSISSSVHGPSLFFLSIDDRCVGVTSQLEFISPSQYLASTLYQEPRNFLNGT